MTRHKSHVTCCALSLKSYPSTRSGRTVTSRYKIDDMMARFEGIDYGVVYGGVEVVRW